MMAYEKALSLLAMREHTKKELKEKLRNKGFKDNEIEEALAKLEKEGAISNARFIEMFIRSRIKKGDSAALIRLKLKDKGISGEDIDNAIDELINSDEYKEMVKRVVKEALSKKEMNKAVQGLVRKGFKTSEIKEALNQAFDEI